ncbi:MAG: GFA family protein [Steroidobacteraceae bacterium]
MRGSCLCGEVRYAAPGSTGDMWYCHCSACARSSGVGFGTWVGATAVKWEAGARSRVRIAGTTPLVRSFCATCSTPLPAECGDGGSVMLPAGGLDDISGLRPAWHAHVAQRAPWMPASARLPCYPGSRSAASQIPAASQPGPASPHRPRSPLTGGCLCGAIGYEIATPPYAMRACHCSRCRRRSGSSYLVALACASSGFTFTHGAGSIRHWQLPESARYLVSFCGECGASVPSVIGEVAFITAGALDSDPGVRTRCHIYFGSRAAWVDAEDDLPHFDAWTPPDFSWSRDETPAA